MVLQAKRKDTLLTGGNLQDSYRKQTSNYSFLVFVMNVKTTGPCNTKNKQVGLLGNSQNQNLTWLTNWMNPPIIVGLNILVDEHSHL